MSASTRNIIAWILQALLALAFIASGGHKLLDSSGTVSEFNKLGLPSWFAYFIAVAEVLGGIGLLIPKLMRLAAIGLGLIMAGAVWMHLTVILGGPALAAPALLLLLLLGLVVQLRRTAPTAPVA